MWCVCHVRCHHVDMNHGSQWRELKISSCGYFTKLCCCHCAVGAQARPWCNAPCWFMFGLETLLLRTAHIAMHTTLGGAVESFSSSDRKGSKEMAIHVTNKRCHSNTYTQLLLPTAVAVVLKVPLLFGLRSTLLRHSPGNSWADGDGDSLVQRAAGGEVLRFNTGTDTFRETLLWLSFQTRFHLI